MGARKMQSGRSSSTRVASLDIEEIHEGNVELEFEGNSIDLEKGNIWSTIFHLINSGIGVHALLLPVSFATLGWAWGVSCLIVGFIWPLYTRWLLIQLHEPKFGVRYGRFAELAFAAFGMRLGIPVALFNSLYISGQCAQMIGMGGSSLKLLYALICANESNCPKQLSPVEWRLVFACLAIMLAQHPNLNSLRWVSLLGTILSLLYCTLLWIMSLVKDKVAGASYDPMYEDFRTSIAKLLHVSFTMEIIGLSFRGHNLSLEIQGTLPSNSRNPSPKTMWKAVKIAYLLIAISTFPIVIVGYWAYGDKVTKQGILDSFGTFHRDSSSLTVLGLALLFLSLHNLCSYPVHAIPTVANIELIYQKKTKKQCSFWLSRMIRLMYGGLTLFSSIAFPFLPNLVPIIGGISILPLTFSYPCFMWIAIMKPKPWGPNFFLNLGLGCLGIIMIVFFVTLAICKVAREGVGGRLFHPR